MFATIYKYKSVLIFSINRISSHCGKTANNEYSYRENGTEKKLFHLDLYRLKDEEEAVRAGIEDCLYSENICLVEWPEKAPGIFPPGTLHIYIQIIDSAERKLHLDDKIN